MKFLFARVVAVGIAVSLAGCSTSRHEPVAPLDQNRVFSETMKGDYARLASCAYQRLDRSQGNGIKKIDLPDQRQSKLALETGGVRYWELTFTAAGLESTVVDFTVVQTIWGPDTLSTKGVMPEVRTCVDTMSLESAKPTVVAARSPSSSLAASKTTYVKKGRGGCGSRGGAGYRLPSGKCASRKR